MKHTIEISSEDLSQIISNDLKHNYKWHLDSKEDYELLDAIEVMLQYYMKPSDYNEWFKTRGRE
jgi:hypothetical protein